MKGLARGASSPAQDVAQRREGVKRIQLGLSGLVAVVLLIGLANIVVDNVRKEEGVKTETAEAAANAVRATPATGSPSEPLAELGVAPATAENGEQQPIVADLQPDPNLKEPMDRPSSGQRPLSSPQPRPAQQR